jgi:DNA-directed RNA polymerase specialized sigma24 family protein
LDASPIEENRRGLTQERFDCLLKWLHSDREQAGEIYEEIRSSLVGGFRAHGCPVPDELADETINRVAGEGPEFFAAYVGAPIRYFRRVAHYVHLEYLRRQRRTVPLPDDMDTRAPVAEDVEQEYGCLEECIGQLRPGSRELVLQYYQGEKRVKIELRRKLATRLNTQLPQLRLKAHRIRVALKECIMDCLRQKAA